MWYSRRPLLEKFISCACWCDGINTFSAQLALCGGNTLVSNGFESQWLLTFSLLASMDKMWSKQSMIKNEVHIYFWLIEWEMDQMPNMQPYNLSNRWDTRENLLHFRDFQHRNKKCLPRQIRPRYTSNTCAQYRIIILECDIPKHKHVLAKSRSASHHLHIWCREWY